VRSEAVRGMIERRRTRTRCTGRPFSVAVFVVATLPVYGSDKLDHGMTIGIERTPGGPPLGLPGRGRRQPRGPGEEDRPRGIEAQYAYHPVSSGASPMSGP